MTSCLVCVVSSPQYPAIWGVGSFWRSGNFPNQGSSWCFVSQKHSPSRSCQAQKKIVLILFSRISLSKFNDFSAGPNLKLHLSSLTLRYWQSPSDWGAAAIFTFLKRFHFSSWIALQKLKPKIREIDFLKVWFTFHINVVVKRNDN